MEPNQTVEEEVWAGEVAYWDSVRNFDLDRYASLWHDAVVGWPNNQPAPLNKSAILKLMSAVLAVLQPGSVEVHLKRLSVLVVGEVGIAYLEVSSRAVTKAGTDFRFQERFTHTWLRTPGGWKIIGGMAAPPAPGAPSIASDA